MARKNEIQFQSGMSLPAFPQAYGSEEQCRQCYRFNRRFDLAALVPRLIFAAALTPPLPYRIAILDA